MRMHNNQSRSPHLKADVLPFAVTVQPEHQIVTALGLALQVPADMRLQFSMQQVS